ncbi:small conductance mechanosensitive channel [Nocardioides ginsengisegetis]|uniref:Small conductance mechanosensitive channel n=1 Tax=Nocardioides ginsengisegetis TaxID=661491 RepID=A0A7W3J0Z8_9ACTN|nr:mechanosensitive ion channel family protein [Nocardioides ginsengisegetis]MBA8804310.1 small conductance mechanosensitive channel [Nocardioides ginsengisegetis]
MFPLETTTPCAAGEQICKATMEITGNQRLANASDLLIGKPLALAGLLVLALAIRWVLHKLVDRLVRRAEDGVLPSRMPKLPRGAKATAARGATPTARDLVTATRRVQRAKTMGDLLKSIITGVVVAIIGTMMLSELGLNIAPIIASAGIIGLAVGFGAQSLVKDFLSGIFMIFEDQYGVGDVVDVGEASGVIEAVSLRVTRLRDLNGTVWYVPNGAIMRVGNMSQNWSRAVVDISVGFGEDLAKVQRIMTDVAHDLWEDDDFKGLIIEEPEVTGVEAFGPESVSLRVLIKTAPMEQWGVAREMRQRIKARFDHEGIEIPLPQRVVWHREEKAAQAAEEAATPAD